MNRILQFLRPRCSADDCPCQEARALHARVTAECERIEELADGVFEFVVPTIGRLVFPRKADDEEDEAPEIHIMLQLDRPAAGLHDDLAAYAVNELREMAAALTAAANRVEGAIQ